MKNIYLLIISFSLVSCYTYKVKVENEENPQENKKSGTKSPATDIQISAKPQAMNAMQTEMPQKIKPAKTKIQAPTNIESKLEANKFYRIEVGGQSHKIQVDKWESDTLVAHVINKPKKILKFHKNQINETTIAERRFSQPVADIITVTAYAGLGVGIYLLLK